MGFCCLAIMGWRGRWMDGSRYEIPLTMTTTTTAIGDGDDDVV